MISKKVNFLSIVSLATLCVGSGLLAMNNGDDRLISDFSERLRTPRLVYAYFGGYENAFMEKIIEGNLESIKTFIKDTGGFYKVDEKIINMAKGKPEIKYFLIISKLLYVMHFDGGNHGDIRMFRELESLIKNCKINYLELLDAAKKIDKRILYRFLSRHETIRHFFTEIEVRQLFSKIYEKKARKLIKTLVSDVIKKAEKVFWEPTARKDIKAFVSDLVKKVEKKVEDENLCCSICLEPIKDSEENVVELKCGGKHKFHEPCINDWYNNGGNTCPNCREKVIN